MTTTSPTATVPTTDRQGRALTSRLYVAGQGRRLAGGSPFTELQGRYLQNRYFGQATAHQSAWELAA